jgi:hypothetical protein
MFRKEVAEALKFYVYRLIDPRNGETFYIGKGKGNRVFDHARGELAAGEDELDDKLQRIREIRVDGFEVAHVIHRHGLATETLAFEIESALIDAYPGATNLVGGHDSDTRGVMHSKQIIERYEAQVADFKHRLVIISINRTATERASIYEAVRYAWKLDSQRAKAAEYILAVQQGLIVGVFKASRWIEATPENFPGTSFERRGRWGFVGHGAPPEIEKLYLRKRIPNTMRKKGGANPVKYFTVKVRKG